MQDNKQNGTMSFLQPLLQYNKGDIPDDVIEEFAAMGIDLNVNDIKVEEKDILCKFGKFNNVKPEQANVVFKDVLEYENIQMLGDNLFEYDPKKDLKMTRLMINFTAYSGSYNQDEKINNFRQYSQVENKDLGGNDIFDILAIKFGFKEYCKMYSAIKEQSRSSVSKGIFSIAKGLLDEVSKGAFSAINDDLSKDFMERNYKNRRDRVVNKYKEVIRKYDFRPLQIGEIIKGKVNELILIDTVKDEFETTEEYNRRVKNSYNKRFSEVFYKYQETIYKTVKNKIIDYNRQKALIMLYSSYFLYINKEKLSLGQYDADKGCFKLTDGWNQYSLSMPRTVARNFKESFSNIKPNFYIINSLNKDKIILKWLISYNFNNEKYFTDSLTNEISI